MGSCERVIEYTAICFSRVHQMSMTMSDQHECLSNLYSKRLRYIQSHDAMVQHSARHAGIPC